MIRTLVTAVLMLVTGSAHATPLTLTYTITDLGGGDYLYDFSLVLDDNDGTWAPGNEWDWIVFGDRAGSGTAISGFSPTGPSRFTFTSWDPIITPLSTTGYHQGPTLQIHDDLFLPGWSPTQIGESLEWSGTSRALLPQGAMWWGHAQHGGGVPVESTTAFYFSNQVVPEPATSLLLGLALVGLAIRTRRSPRAFDRRADANRSGE